MFFKRFLKSLISILCMITYCSLTYASLSASDGSAFVTKSEFDSSISDFNARLTTFEAGINSKIDSQVTSYLDRNGIWSGKNQTEIKGTNINLHRVSGAEGGAAGTSCQIDDLGASGSNVKGDGVIMCQYIGKINKSGLCRIVLSDYADVGTINQKRIYCRFENSYSNWTTDNSLSLKYRFVKLPSGKVYLRNNPKYSSTSAQSQGFPYYNDGATTASTPLGWYAWNSASLSSFYEFVPYNSQTQMLYPAEVIYEAGGTTQCLVWVQFGVPALNSLYFFVSKDDELGFLAYYQYGIYSGAGTQQRIITMQARLGTKITEATVY